MLVVFGVWGLSSLFSSLERLLKFPPWLWVYLFVFISIIVDSYFVLKYWKPSPFRLYTKSKLDFIQDYSTRLNKCSTKWLKKMSEPTCLTDLKVNRISNAFNIKNPHIPILFIDLSSERLPFLYSCCGYIVNTYTLDLM